jgi:hypothetical protein
MLGAMSGPARRRGTTLATVVLALSLLTLLSACGGALPEESGPAGVDGLVVPTPSADPADFVDGIDNPWLPLTPGSTWRYRSVDGGLTAMVTVSDETREVQGVATTAVEEVVTGSDGEVLAESSAWFAQDVEGNVWSFGERRTAYDDRGRREPDGSWEWEAGVAGAQAGLAMPARPRVGDGYRQEYAEGTAEDRVTVLSLDAVAQVGAVDRTGLLQTEHVSGLVPAVVVHRYHERGTGLVVEETVAGGTGALELVAHDPA